MYLSDRPRQSMATPTATPTGPSREKRGKRVGTTVLLMGVVSMLTDISSESLSAILPLYITTVLGLSPLAYGVIDGIYQGVSALVRILGGWLSDRADRPKWIAFTGYGLSAITKVLLIPLQSFAAVTAVITIDRLGKGIRTAPRDAIIATATPEAELGRAFGVHRALDTLGAVIGPLLAFVILWLVPGDFTSVFIASFAAALLGLAVLGLLVPDLRPRRTRHTTTTTTTAISGAGEGRSRELASGKRASLRNAAGPAPSAPAPRPSLRLLRGQGMGRLVVAAALLGMLTISDGFLYLSLQQRDSFAATYFPLLFVGTNVAYFALAVPIGRLADRVGRARVLVFGHVLLIGAYACAAGPTGGLLTTLLCLLCLGAFYAATDGVLSALTTTLVPASVRAMGIATTQTVVAIARFGSSLLFGLLWLQIGRGPAVTVFAIALAVAVPVAWILLRDVRTRMVTA